MIPTSGQERRADTKSQLLEQLHDPMHLRFIVAAAVLGIGYAVVYHAAGPQHHGGDAQARRFGSDS